MASCANWDSRPGRRFLPSHFRILLVLPRRTILAGLFSASCDHYKSSGKTCRHEKPRGAAGSLLPSSACTTFPVGFPKTLVPHNARPLARERPAGVPDRPCQPHSAVGLHGSVTSRHDLDQSGADALDEADPHPLPLASARNSPYRCNRTGGASPVPFGKARNSRRCWLAGGLFVPGKRKPPAGNGRRVNR